MPFVRRPEQQQVLSFLAHLVVIDDDDTSSSVPAVVVSAAAAVVVDDDDDDENGVLAHEFKLAALIECLGGGAACLSDFLENCEPRRALLNNFWETARRRR